MQDLSSLLGDPITVLAPTSQAGGNQVFSNEQAKTAPGSQPASPANSVAGEIIDHEAPEVQASGGKVPVGSGKRSPQASASLPAGGIKWSKTPSGGSHA